MRPPVDLRLYVIVDPAVAGERDLAEIASAAVAGGATLVQLRDKNGDGGAVLERALALRAVLGPAGVPLLINDRVDVALAAAADGVHVGQSDLPATVARRLLGPDALVGLSLDGGLVPPSTDEAAAIDYVAAGPAYVTGSKADAGAAIGACGVARARAATDLPLVAIGGIDAGNAPALVAAGADGVSVISAVVKAADPAAAAAELRAAVDAALAERGGRS